MDLFASWENAQCPLWVSAIGHGRLLPPIMAQGSLICLSASPSDSSLISAHSGRGSDGHSGGSGRHKRVTVPITDSVGLLGNCSSSRAVRMHSPSWAG